ncbi:SpnB-like Rossmann fold domain-containing protein, partial [Streptomyces malaysiensis]|uniref:SpnB-like Rossmann fold domain-containing protein n=1 Tax=Streptomyces malaysiensis TaxID=92644 RepID=UPI00321FA5F9|nr:polyketide synthase dehydratase domain-containing protein [Streptomyces malaysiensis]
MESIGHPLLDAGVPLPDSDGHFLTGRWSLRTHPWLADHTVRGRTVVPGTALVETVLRAADSVGCDRLDELSLETPVVLPEDGGVLRVQVTITGSEGSDGRRYVSLHTCGADGVWTRHARGTVLTAGVSGEPAGLGSWPPAGARPVETAGLYERLSDEGLGYGPVFRGLETVWRRGEEIYAEAALPEVARRACDGFGVHPALLDAALHAWAAGSDDAGSDDAGPGAVRLPFLWSGVTLHATGATKLRVRLTPVTGGGMSVLVADDTGRPVASVETLVTRPLGEGGGDPADTHTTAAPHRVEWTPLPAMDTEGRARRLAVVSGEALGLDRLADGYEDLADLAGQVAAGECPPPDYVLAGIGPCAGTDVASEAVSTAGRALSLVQDWLADETSAATGARLVLVTRGAVAVATGEGVSDLAASPVWGLVRSAQTEHPGRFVLVDLDADEGSLTALPAALDTGEPQLALRRGEPSIPGVAAVPATPKLPDGPWRLQVDPDGELDGMSLVPCDAATRALGAQEVRIEVRAVGLNFRDVLISLGMYPDAENALLGSEGAGVVVEVGSGVTEVCVGDRVMGVWGDGFR